MLLLFVRRACLRVALAVCLILPATVPAAAPGGAHLADAGPPLTLAVALARAEARHPLFDAYRAQLRAADGRGVQAAVRPAPEINLTVENALGTGQMAGYSAAETTLGFSQLIERGGLRDRRIEAARADRQLLVTDAEIARLDLRAEVARRFVHVLSDQAQLGITREATGLARSTLTEVERRVAAARAPLAERSRAEISLERARLDEEHAEHELLSSRRHLAAVTGAMGADFGQAEGDLLYLPPVADFAVLLAQVKSTPDLLRFASEARLRDSELRLAQARRTAGLTLGAGLRRLEATNDTALVFSASMPLFGAARERGNLLEGEARAAQVAPERAQAMLKAQAQLFEIWQELNHARVEVQAHRERVIPLVQQALEQTRYAYERGRYSLLELRDAQAEWATQRRRLIQAAAEYHGRLIEIQRLTGAPAPVATEPSQP